MFEQEGKQHERLRQAVFKKKIQFNLDFSLFFNLCVIGLQTGILNDSKENRNKINLCICKDLDILDTEIKQLEQKEAVEYVPLNEVENGFCSTFFLVPKKTGDMRPVLNLKPLNILSPKQHFRMDSISTVRGLVKQGWGISLDLNFAYLHVQIYEMYISEVLSKKDKLISSRHFLFVKPQPK